MSAEAIRPGYARALPRGASKLAAAKEAGLPAGAVSAALFLVSALALIVFLATGGRGEALAATAAAAGRTDLASLGFQVKSIHLQGASPAAQKQIIAAAGLRSGGPILDEDLAAIRSRVEQVPWVASARVIRLLPDTLVVAVNQRPLMAVWQHDGQSVVVGDNGAVMPDVPAAALQTLPLVVGDGANTAAAAILPQIASRPRLGQHVSALVRVDDRRWNLVLNDGGVVMLPARDEARALRRLDALDHDVRILDLGLARIDLRDPEMVIVRPRGTAAPALAGGGV